MSTNYMNSGGLWKENAKTDKHPNFKGEINIEGKEYWLSAWATRNPDGGRPHIGLKAELKEQKQPQADVPAPGPQKEFDDDIPF